MKVDKRNWKGIVSSCIDNVRNGNATYEQAMRDIEATFLIDASVEERDLWIELGDLALGAWRNAFQWLADLARYNYVRFYGITWGRVYFGLLVGSKTPPSEIERNERISELTRIQEEHHVSS